MSYKIKKNVQGNITFIFNVLSENVITFLRKFLKIKPAFACANVRKYFMPQISIIQFNTYEIGNCNTF